MRMKFLPLLLLLLNITIAGEANPVDFQTARKVAFKFMNANVKTPLCSMEEMQLAKTYTIGKGSVAFRVFNAPTGFVIVSADDCASPILGYSDEGQFDENRIPPQMEEWLQGYVKQIQSGIENGFANDFTANQWASVMTSGVLFENPIRTSVEPLLTTMWNQDNPYNRYCPTGSGSGGHVYAGAIATAMAQIMKYWNWPEHGFGSHTYTPSGYPQQTVDFENTYYQWSNMPNTCNNSNYHAVATLIYHCGVAVDMQYGSSASYASHEDVSAALTNYFGYSSELYRAYRSSYSDDEWISMLKSSLNRGCPVYYSGDDGNAINTHAFVCDGYNESDMFHINWGWSGFNNNYFAISALNTNVGSFSNNSYAIFNIHPTATFMGGSTTNHWSDPNNWIPNELPTETSSVNIMADVDVNVDVNVVNVTIFGNNVVIVNPDVTLTVTGTISAPAASSIVVEEGGQLVHANEGVLATVKRAITPYTAGEKDGWHLIASPLLNNVNVSEVRNMMSGEYDLYYYDEPSVYWINYEDADNNFNTLKNGQGYLYGNKCFALPFESQLGNGTSTEKYFPFYTSYENSISESLFLAEELENAGVSNTTPMTSLSWYATSSTGYLQSNLSIWMANVNESALTATSHNTSNMTLVYTGAMTPEIGWNEFEFNEGNFVWDGISNVLICVQRNNGAWQYNPINWQSHNCGFVSMTYKYRDETPYNMMNETYSVSTSTVRANTIFKALGGQGESITISFIGELKNGSATVNVPLSYTTGHALQGFNLVGNPYAHNVTSYASVNVANGCYVMNEAKDDLIVSEISEENPLKPAEGFFVKATAAGASITFNPGRGSTATQSGTIRVELMENDKLIDRLLVKTAEGQPLEKFSLNERRTRLFAQGERQELAIVPCEGNEQAVNFKAAKNGKYTISVNADGMDFSYLHLIDNLTGADVDLLAEPSYTFEAKTSDYASRFKLVFSACGDADGDNETFAFISNGNIVITEADTNSTLQIVDVMGRVVVNTDVARNVSTSGMSAGVYVLRLINGNDVRTQKIVVE